jgi:hypothetical protein
MADRHRDGPEGPHDAATRRCTVRTPARGTCARRREEQGPRGLELLPALRRTWLRSGQPRPPYGIV